VEATNVTRVSDTEIRVTVPKDAKDGPITVKTSAGTATSRESFKILAAENAENAERRV